MNDLKHAAIVDFETFAITGRPSYPPEPVGVAISVPGRKSKYYAWAHPLGGNTCTWAEARAALGEVWDSNRDVAFHHAKFDLSVCVHKMRLPMLPWKRLHDTMLMLFLDDPRVATFSLKPSADRLLGLPPDERDAVEEWLLEHQPIPGVKLSTSKQSEWYVGAFIAYAPVSLVGPYAIGDVDRTRAIGNLLLPRLAQRRMLEAYDRERKLISIAMELEEQGVRVAHARLAKDVDLYGDVAQRLDKWLCQRLKVPADTNLNSGPELVKALVKGKAVDTTKLGVTKTGKDQTNKEALGRAITDKQVEAALIYRAKLKTNLGTFMEPWLETANRSGGYIFTEWHSTRTDENGTKSGRFSSSRFQNMSKELEEPLFADADHPLLPKAPIALPKVYLPLIRGYVTTYEDGDVLIDRDYCLAEGTLVDTPNGPTPIEQMSPGTLVYTYNHSTQKPDCSKVASCRCTGVRPTLIVELDNGERVRCTATHRWLRLDGSEVHASALRVGDRLLPIRRGSAGPKRYETLYSRSTFQYVYTHQVIVRARDGELRGRVHHDDEDQLNNTPDNLLNLTVSEHAQRHRNNVVAQWRRPKIRAKMVTGIAASIARSRGGFRGSANPNYGKLKGSTRVCPSCDQSFYRQKSNSAKYCSRQCYFNAQRGLTDLNHRVRSITYDGLHVRTWDIEVKRDHNFALMAGVFVHNSQQEYRILAHFEGGALMRAYLENPWIDLHEHSRLLINDLLHANFTRKPVKNTGFGILYGLGLEKLALKNKCTVEVADQLRKAFKQIYPGLKDIQEVLKQRERDHEPVRTWGGREYFCEEPKLVTLPNGAKKLQTYGYRMLNYLIQPSAADCTKEAIVRYWEHKPTNHRVLTIPHDELLVSVPAKERDVGMELLRQAMESVEFSVPMLSDGKWSPTDWATLKTYDKAGKKV